MGTIEVFDWLFEHKLVRVGTVIYYDDWTGAWCAHSCVHNSFRAPWQQIGEIKAHIEAAAKYGVRFLCVAGICKMPSRSSCDVHYPDYAVFVVTAVGSADSHNGIEMTTAELEQWGRRNNICQIGFKRRHLEPATDPGGCWSVNYASFGDETELL